MAIDIQQDTATTELLTQPEEALKLDTPIEFAFQTMNQLDGRIVSNMDGLIMEIQGYLVGALSSETSNTINSLQGIARSKRQQYLDGLPKDVCNLNFAQEELRNGNVTKEWFEKKFPFPVKNPIGFTSTNQELFQGVGTTAKENEINTLPEMLTDEERFATNVLQKMDGSNINIMFELISQIRSFAAGKFDPETANILKRLEGIARTRRQDYLEQIIDNISMQYAQYQLREGLINIEWYNKHFPEKEGGSFGFAPNNK